MANALDLLLGGKINAEKPSKEVKIKRLSSKDVDFVVTVTAITMDDFKHVQEMNRKGSVLDEIAMNLMLLTYGVREFDPKLAENKERFDEIKKAYGVSTMEKFLNKILLPGEISSLSMEIINISGFNDDMVEDVKKE